ncbi:MAG: RIP metalloprotease RseP [Bacteroidales bacterium]|nr:RIP metalloprotease RseP [Bacteroidales bacterium]
MEVLIKIAQLLLSLSILVVIHEFGHYTFAKIFKTRVEKFYLFFNPWFSLFKFKRGETEYGMGWLPLGGYVKISGMIDESMDKEQMKKPPQPWEFRSKSSPQRLLIMLGGVLYNFILAFLIFASVLYIWGEEYLPNSNVKYGIVCDSVALNMGLQNGDKILSVDYNELDNFRTIVHKIILDDAKTIQIDRNGEKINIDIPEETISYLLKKPDFINTRFPISAFVIDGFVKDSPAKTAGLQKGDKITGINNNYFEFFDEFKEQITKNKNTEIILNITRGTNKLNIPVKVNELGMIGVAWDTKMFRDIFEYKKIEYGFFAAFPAGIKKGYNLGIDYLKQFKLLFQPKTKAYESLGGFITIGNIFPGVWDWKSFWFLTAFLSILLGVINVMPIPALDGGHVMFLLYEVISGRKPSDKFLEYAQITGMIILFSLLIYANGNDIVKLFNK